MAYAPMPEGLSLLQNKQLSNHGKGLLQMTDCYGWSRSAAAPI